ncbi:MAG: TetR/AcrR family transcriptional regulator [Pseudomonadales bacterium]
MSQTITAREQLIERLLGVFQASGYDGATLTQLAAAAGIGKAGLYHHFPGGKAEMADVLVRHAAACLEREAFARLAGNAPPAQRLAAFVEGFCRYVEDGETHCLLAVLAQGSAHGAFAEQLAQQYEAWLQRLASVYEATGLKPKRAARAASDLLQQLYGALVLSKLLNDPRHFRRASRRIGKALTR